MRMTEHTTRLLIAAAVLSSCGCFSKMTRAKTYHVEPLPPTVLGVDRSETRRTLDLNSVGSDGVVQIHLHSGKECTVTEMPRYRVYVKEENDAKRLPASFVFAGISLATAAAVPITLASVDKPTREDLFPFALPLGIAAGVLGIVGISRSSYHAAKDGERVVLDITREGEAPSPEYAKAVIEGRPSTAGGSGQVTPRAPSYGTPVRVAVPVARGTAGNASWPTAQPRKEVRPCEGAPGSDMPVSIAFRDERGGAILSLGSTDGSGNITINLREHLKRAYPGWPQSTTEVFPRARIFSTGDVPTIWGELDLTELPAVQYDVHALFVRRRRIELAQAEENRRRLLAAEKRMEMERTWSQVDVTSMKSLKSYVASCSEFEGPHCGTARILVKVGAGLSAAATCGGETACVWATKKLKLAKGPTAAGACNALFQAITTGNIDLEKATVAAGLGFLGEANALLELILGVIEGGSTLSCFMTEYEKLSR